MRVQGQYRPGHRKRQFRLPCRRAVKLTLTNALVDSLIDPDNTTLDLIEHSEGHSQGELLLESIDKPQLLLE